MMASNTAKNARICNAMAQDSIMACCSMCNASEHTMAGLFIVIIVAAGRHCAVKLALICTSKLCQGVTA